eukprot:8451007-Pyramimonas_sp.AAC.1
MCIVLGHGWLAFTQQAQVRAPPPSASKVHADAKWIRGARACFRFRGTVHFVWYFARGGWLSRNRQGEGTPPSVSKPMRSDRGALAHAPDLEATCLFLVDRGGGGKADM